MFWLIIISSLCGGYYLYDLYHMYWFKKGVKQRYVFPILGNTYQNFIKMKAMYDIVIDLYNSFEARYIGFCQLTIPTLMLKDIELIKEVCVRDFEHFLDHRPIMEEIADPLWNKNLFALRGQKWKEMRTILSPSFTGSKIRQMFTLMHKCAEEFVDFFNDNSAEILEMDLKDTFTRYTNDIIATTAFGIQCDSLRNRDNEFYTKGRQTTNFSGVWKMTKFMLSFIWSGFGKIFKPAIFDEDVTNFFRKTISETIDFRTKNNVQRPDMIHLLMQARKDNHQNTDEIETTEEANFAAVPVQLLAMTHQKEKFDLSLDDITSQALIFFVAGFETVSIAMCFLAYELALNPDIQKKLIHELDECRERNDTVTYETLTKLSYLDMVVSETLRKWTPTLATDRYCNKPYTIEPRYPDEKEVHLFPGDIIWVPIAAIHHDPKYWPNPEKFDPERFSAKNKEKIKPYTYLPFGIGPRNCIGSRFALIEVKALFYGLLAHFEIVPTEKTSIPFVINKAGFTLSSANGFWLGLKKRKSANL